MLATKLPGRPTIFAVVLIAVTIAVLYVARDFIGQHTGAYILGAKHN